MPTINLSTHIKAPQQRVFDLSRSITLHTVSMQHTSERAVAGKTSGLIELNETVTWEAKHLFKKQYLKTVITAMSPYTMFIDEMVEGDFKKMKHGHFFSSIEEGTIMKDVFYFESPFGLLGKLINELFLFRYMKNLLEERNAVIKDMQKVINGSRSYCRKMCISEKLL